MAKENGIAVAYYSLQFNNQCVEKHPDWGWVNEDGVQQRERWYITCLDTPYRQYVLKMMDEIFSRYEFSELFIDIFGIQFWHYHTSGRNPFCFCKYTENAWDQDHPDDPYVKASPRGGVDEALPVASTTNHVRYVGRKCLQWPRNIAPT